MHNLYVVKLQALEVDDWVLVWVVKEDLSKEMAAASKDHFMGLDLFVIVAGKGHISKGCIIYKVGKSLFDRGTEVFTRQHVFLHIEGLVKTIYHHQRAHYKYYIYCSLKLKTKKH